MKNSNIKIVPEFDMWPSADSDEKTKVSKSLRENIRDMVNSIGSFFAGIGQAISRAFWAGCTSFGNVCTRFGNGISNGAKYIGKVFIAVLSKIAYPFVYVGSALKNKVFGYNGAAPEVDHVMFDNTNLNSTAKSSILRGVLHMPANQSSVRPELIIGTRALSQFPANSAVAVKPKEATTSIFSRVFGTSVKDPASEADQPVLGLGK